MPIFDLCLEIVNRVKSLTGYTLDFDICYLDELVLFSYKDIKYMSYDFRKIYDVREIVEDICTELIAEF